MIPKEPEPVKLVISLFALDEGLFGPAIERLEERFGPVDLLSERLKFDYTGYYKEEFGFPLTRKIASFEELVGSEELSSIKLTTNSLEGEFLDTGGKRRINIDPGYITLEKFVLASCKNFSHRIHLGKGVYGELTLIYSGGHFRDLPWTYPDYREEKMKEILHQIRMRYAFKIGRGATWSRA